MNVEQRIAQERHETTLEILVFGPAIEPRAEDPLTASLQDKRQEMKRLLMEEGHAVYYGEDVVDPTLSSPLANPLIQEVAAMRSADFIVVLVSSPGSIAEAVLITTKQELLKKVAFYCLEEHRDGLVARHLEHCEPLGAICRIVSREDVERCELATDVLTKVEALRVAKAFLF